MWLKSKFTKFWQILEKYFLLQFLLSLTILSFTILVFGVKTNINNYVIVSLGSFSLLILFLIASKSYKFKSIINKFGLTFILSTLLLIQLVAFLNHYALLSVATYLNYILFGLLITSTLAYFFISKNGTNVFILETGNKNTPQNQYLNKKIILFLVLFFFIFKLSIPLIYTGSYIDEYNHIFSGITFFDIGEFMEKNEGSTYDRGAYVSILVGLLFSLFGQSIFVAKLLPAIVGTINFFLLLNIIKRVSLNFVATSTLLITYVLSPWILFSHFYIRPYVFYELTILLLCLLFILVLEEIKNNDFKKFLLNSFFIFTTAGTIFFASSEDVHRYILLGICGLFYLYVYLGPLKKMQTQSSIFNTISQTPLIEKALLVTSATATVAYILGFFETIKFVLTSSPGHGSSQENYYNLFFEQNIIFTFLFFLAPLILTSHKYRNNKAVLVVLAISYVLFLLHLFSPTEHHMMRVIMYFLPLFYIVSFVGFFVATKIFNKYIVGVLIFSLGFSLIINYPNNYWKGPYIPAEVNYVDYKRVSEFLKATCSSRDIFVLMHSPYILSFYGVDISYTAYLSTSLLEKDRRYKLDDMDNYITTFGDIPVLTSRDALLEKIDSGNYCFVINEEARHYSRYFYENDFSNLIINYNYVLIGDNNRLYIFY